jgi:bzd-type benzoyl-CoA reductase N subunit
MRNYVGEKMDGKITEMERIEEVDKTLFNPYIKSWKEKGKRVIGYTTVYTPEELFYAAGMLPYRMGGREATNTTTADMYYGPVTCSYARCVLENAADGRFDFLDGAVIAYECDHMRRLLDTWRGAAKDGNARLPPFFEYYGVPHSRGDHASKILMDETHRIIKKFEEHFGVKVTEDGLKDAIKVYNKTRNLLKRLYELRERDEISMTGAEALSIVIASTAMPKDEFNGLLERILEERQGTSSSEKPRLMIVGSVNDDVGLVKLIEDLGAVVVADSLCFGSRCFWDLVEEDRDPLRSIINRYFNHIPCPRMYGEYALRYNFVREAAKRAKIDGVILQHIRCCDMHGAENTLYERDLEAGGIPTLKLERHYGPLADTGRITTRVQAFLERVGR